MPGSAGPGGPPPGMGQPTTVSPVLAPSSPPGGGQALQGPPGPGGQALQGPPGSGGQDQAVAAKAASAKKASRNGYRAKELAEIRNSLRPFEQADVQLRTVSSLSTESSTNSVSSTDGFSSVQEALTRLNHCGYDEVGISQDKLVGRR